MKNAFPLAIVGAAAITALAWWALGPLPTQSGSSDANSISFADRSSGSASESSDTSSSSSSPSSPIALDLAAFRVPLWIAPPAPPPPPTPAPSKPSPPPLKWQLLAIEHDDRGDSALLYDPDGDALLRVRPGQSLGERAIEKVTANGVEIREAGASRTLALRPDRTSPGDRTTGTITSGGSR